MYGIGPQTPLADHDASRNLGNTGSRKKVDGMITAPGGSSSLDDDEGVAGHVEEEGVAAGRAWVP